MGVFFILSFKSLFTMRKKACIAKRNIHGLLKETAVSVFVVSRRFIDVGIQYNMYL